MWAGHSCGGPLVLARWRSERPRQAEYMRLLLLSRERLLLPNARDQLSAQPNKDKNTFGCNGNRGWCDARESLRACDLTAVAGQEKGLGGGAENGPL